MATTEVPVRLKADGPQDARRTADSGQNDSTRDRSRSRGDRNETVAATQIDASSQADTESKPTVPAKKLKLTEPVDPEQAINERGWRRWEQGAEGDCFFRACSVFSNEDLTNQPSLESSKHSGAWIRSQACLHIKKHSARFAEFFPKQASFESWLKSMAKAGKWADGKAIQTVSEKIGQPIVIWEEKRVGVGTDSEATVWTRFVVAGRFSGGFHWSGV